MQLLHGMLNEACPSDDDSDNEECDDDEDSSEEEEEYVDAKEEHDVLNRQDAACDDENVETEVCKALLVETE